MAVESYKCTDPILTYAGAVKNFDYTGGEQTFTAYIGCQYKLEVWGAQGGSVPSANGGYGAYSVGVILDQQTPLYINVGGKGLDSNSKTTNYTGGYNGGGYSTHWHNNDCYAGSGGGASHIAFQSGLLNSFSSKTAQLLLVASGGGGAGNWPGNSIQAQGGNGGGITGNNGAPSQNGDGWYGLGGTQSSGGLYIKSSTIYNRCPPNAGSFGQGGDSSKDCSVNDGNGGGAGAGAGYYGGGGATTQSSAGGGSGYIGSSSLISVGGVTKHMTCYNCTTSTADATRTQSNTCVNATATTDCSKTGNGYARITRLN